MSTPNQSTLPGQATPPQNSQVLDRTHIVDVHNGEFQTPQHGYSTINVIARQADGRLKLQNLVFTHKALERLISVVRELEAEHKKP